MSDSILRFTGAFNQGWIAVRVLRKYSIVLAVVLWFWGSALQTAAIDYAMLTVARLIGGVGIGMLSMVALLHISEVSPPETRGTLLVLEEFSVVTGIVIAFWITYGTRSCLASGPGVCLFSFRYFELSSWAPALFS